MPIYAYGCSSCGLKKDVMQKISDAPLSICPECGKATLVKQLTAAGFQLKGSGYYVTDFKGGAKQSDSGQSDSGQSDAKENRQEGKPDAKPGAKPDAAPAPVPAAGSTPAPVASDAA